MSLFDSSQVQLTLNDLICCVGRKTTVWGDRGKFNQEGKHADSKLLIFDLLFLSKRH
jgi:hypothetical protein